MKIGIVIADGVGYRNFILSDFIKELKSNGNEIIIYSGLIKDVYKKELLNGISFRELEIYKESKISWIFRKLKEVAHLQLHKKSFGIRSSLTNGYPKKWTGLKGSLTKVIYKITTYLNSEFWILIFEKSQFISLKYSDVVAKYKRYLNEDKPDFLFFTHQRPYNLAPFLGAAESCKIKTGTFIFSWDNLPSKGRMLGSFDNYFVWSDLMKHELLYYYSKISNRQIHVIGTPQFEPYVMDIYFTDKAYFVQRFNLDATKKTIYYSCGDVSTSKLDPYYIDCIANFIQNNKIVEPVNFVVRTSPAEDGSRFEALQKKFDFIQWNIPKWPLTRTNHTETWSQRVPDKQDVTDLRALLAYSDLNINMCSTMSLDFMLFDKPVINAVFGNVQNGMYNDQKYLNYDHYKRVVESGAVVIAKTPEELIEAINSELNNPKQRTKQRKELIDLQISKELNGTSKRIVQTLAQLNA
ncbi:hypothetical protein EC396_10915 [Lutibacter sp. HS1-25]|uniref:CDP-glycerol glycerophosphotransferase family protein n=1 Tax=Lutibacter sp. HS1-25 TaxID=2485000 RepID=UPI0010127B6B|nr:CDP-glycerol glycerophosphotransferase family protein [Lutibacter sp. HS1-25]RXP52738.1 hypothetical protein EC396_10915 [Lutibacter sp. HS1-25]